MKKQATAACITIFLLIAAYGIFLTYVSMPKEQIPVATSGVLDLTSWGFAENGVLPLDGEWELYPDKLFTQQDLIPTTAGKN